MENKLQIFSNPEFGQVRTIKEDGQVLFCANDIARALGYEKPRNAVAAHCPHALKRGGVSTTTNQHGITTEQKVEMNFIPEGDVYRLIIRSKLPAAEKFERWVFDEVMPSVVKTGSYGQPVIDVQVITQIATAVAAEFIKQLVPLMGTVGRDEPEQARLEDIDCPKRRRTVPSVISKLDPELRHDVEEMLCSREYTFSDVRTMLLENGIEVSVSSICRYAKVHKCYPT